MYTIYTIYIYTQYIYTQYIYTIYIYMYIQCIYIYRYIYVYTMHIYIYTIYVYIYGRANVYMGVRTYCQVCFCGILPNPMHGKMFDVAAGRVVLRSIKSSIQCLLEHWSHTLLLIQLTKYAILPVVKWCEVCVLPRQEVHPMSGSQIFKLRQIKPHCHVNGMMVRSGVCNYPRKQHYCNVV